LISLGDNVNLKSIAAYRIGLARGDGCGRHASYHRRAWVPDAPGAVQRELQLSGKAFTNRLDYVLGAYYFEERGNLHDYVPFGALAAG
jgi:hypothetical protein